MAKSKNLFVKKLVADAKCPKCGMKMSMCKCGMMDGKGGMKKLGAHAAKAY